MELKSDGTNLDKVTIKMGEMLDGGITNSYLNGFYFDLFEKLEINGTDTHDAGPYLWSYHVIADDVDNGYVERIYISYIGDFNNVAYFNIWFDMSQTNGIETYKLRFRVDD